MRRKPVRQAMILPGGEQVSHDQPSQFENFVEEAFNGCRSHGEYQKPEDDPVRNAHGSMIAIQRSSCNDRPATIVYRSKVHRSKAMTPALAG
jgi:hypothetical protein